MRPSRPRRAADASATRRYCFFVPMSLYVTFDLASIRVEIFTAPRATRRRVSDCGSSMARDNV